MSFGDIMALVFSTEVDEPVLAAAEALSNTHAMRVSATLISVAQTSAYGFDAVGAAAAAGARSASPLIVHPDADDEYVGLIRRLDSFSDRVRVERVEYVQGASAELAAIQSRRANLTILRRPRGAPHAPLRTGMLERILFESGRPVLLVPPGWCGKTLGRTILVAWDGSRAATLAIADAQPLLAVAENIFLVTIEDEAHGGLPVGDIAAHLRHLGLSCQQRTAPGSNKTTSMALQEECEAVGADLMVMGGYGHSRLQEKLFGGVTRSLVATSPTPLFISR
jgi:nucleotide-binding universal stress UspA family protein